MIKILLSGNRIDIKYLSSSFNKYPDIKISTVHHEIFDVIRKTKDVLCTDIIHIVSAKLTGIEGMVWTFIFFLLWLLRKKIILHWIGTDVLEANKIIVSICSRMITLQLVNAPWLIDELEAKGAKSETMILPSSMTKATHTQLPKEFTILVYLGEPPISEKRSEFYGGKTVKRLIKTTLYKFIILGGNDNNDFANLSNVEYLSHVERDKMNEIYARSTVLLRLTKHDATSHMVQESLNRGRYVIWTHKFPFCLYANDYDSALARLKTLEHETELNSNGMEYFKNYLSDDLLTEKIVELYRRLSIARV